MKNLIPANLKVTLIPVSILLVLIILTIAALNFGFAKIGSQRDELTESGRAESVLREKQNILNQAGASILSFADTSLVAVPDENPAFVVLAQLRNLGVAKGVTLGTIKIGNPVADEGNALRIDVTFDVDGETGAALDYVKAIAGFTPLTTITKVKMSQSQGAARLTVNLQAYWAPLPTTLPKLTEPLKELSAEENQLVNKLGSLTPPPFSKITPSAPSGRLDPFNF